MSETRERPDPRLRWVGLVLLAGIALVAVLATAPDWSVRLYEVAAVEPLIGWGAWLSEAAVLALVALYVGAGIRALLDRTPPRTSYRDRLSRLVAGGIAAVLAYGLNLVLKEQFAAVRPCHLHDVASACPPVDSWTFPSNHTVIAFSLAVVLTFTWPGLTWLVLPLAVVAGSARVLAGDHYPHDVMAGAVVGTVICLGALALIRPAMTVPARTRRLRHRRARRTRSTR